MRARSGPGPKGFFIDSHADAPMLRSELELTIMQRKDRKHPEPCQRDDMGDQCNRVAGR